MSNAEKEGKPKNVAIERAGNKIIIPDKMSYDDARKWLTKQEQAEETAVAVSDEMPCFPLDGMIALMRAMDEIYGFTDISARSTWFGTAPPVMFQIDTPNGVETAALGRIASPTWEGGYIETNINGPSVRVSGVIKRKFEKQVKDVLILARKLLKERSIYRGQSFQVDLHWWDDPEGENTGKPFHPINDAPKFMVTSDADMILNDVTEFELCTSVFMILEQSQLCKENGISLKHGALFKGPFGTGKTMTAQVIAHKAKSNGWSFIYLKSADQLANGLRLAKMYAPAVVFVEDVDTVVKERNDKMNDLLNVIDGVDTKSAPIMVILTTNNPDSIDPSFLRAGRIDTVIHFGEPDAATAIRFVEKFANGLIRKNEDLTAVGLALEGLVPAFVREAVNKAKRYTIYREKTSNIDGCMTADDLLKAANAVREHLKMMESRKPGPEQVIAHAARTLHQYGQRGQVLEPLALAKRI